MTFSEYINWIINHPENFSFTICKVKSGTKVYIIHYTDPYTGRIREIINCLLVGPVLVDISTNISVASSKDILLEKLEALALNKEQEALDKGEENIEDEA